ncbi:sulfotransferase family protein [Parasphingopyxis lamellibrachiae]|uniref:Sulfotransferase family protein n=1 Tax=Parasphingopyxis lamellibrachiae TaxID=680125 RepID=A0A3D9FEB9_9SPHN|nr:sulfotransferase family protein [Parasphingopyxis lamellibrachiae]RED16170.1 hypothetical protein DFR46_1186 [Parasphingopyxis lamellibrachiae]
MTFTDAQKFHFKILRGLLSPYAGQEVKSQDASRSIVDLLSDCQKLRAQNGFQRARLRTIHHFAGTGGTLISRAIAAQPNIILLSEVDPFSSLDKKAGLFRPTDIVALGDIGVRAYQRSGAGAVFLAGLEVFRKQLRMAGQTLILRDHTHSHFCTENDIGSRPVMKNLLRGKFEVRSVITVRHPLDSFLSIMRQNWIHFEPKTLEEYARRYHAFLDAYAESPVFRYEDFVARPSEILAKIASFYEISIASNWQEIMQGVVLSGDSGRRGDVIQGRPRQEIPDSLKSQECESPSYSTLCERLDYDPNFAAAANAPLEC